MRLFHGFFCNFPRTDSLFSAKKVCRMIGIKNTNIKKKIFKSTKIFCQYKAIRYKITFATELAFFILLNFESCLKPKKKFHDERLKNKVKLVVVVVNTTFFRQIFHSPIILSLGWLLQLLNEKRLLFTCSNFHFTGVLFRPINHFIYEICSWQKVGRVKNLLC